MESRIAKFVLIPVLTLALVVMLVLSSAFIFEPAYAGTERSATYGNVLNDGYTNWEFGQNLAGGDITEKSKTISNKVTVILNEDERKLADDGYLSYVATVHIGANGSRTVEPLLRTKCYDEDGNELSTGKYNKNTSTYWVAHASYDYSSGNVILPAGTAKVEYYAEVHINTKGSLELEDMVFAINSDLPENEYVPISDQVTDIQIYESYDGDGNGIGQPVTNYYDMFKNSYKRLNIADAEMLYKAAVYNNENLSRWSQLAYQIYKGNSNTYWDWEGGGFDKDFGSGVYTDLVADFSNKVTRNNDSNIITRSTGICMADSFDDAVYKMLENQAGLRNRNAEAEDFLDRHEAISLGSDAEDSQAQTVFYTSVSTSDAYGGTFKYGYNTMGIVFYDFCLVPLIDKEPYTTANMTGGDPDVETTLSSFDNESKEDYASFQKSIGHTSGSSTTNTVTNSSSTTMTNSAGGDFTISGKLGLSEVAEMSMALRLAYNFSFSEMFGQSTSDSISHNESISDTTSTSIQVPPRTRANVKSESEKISFSMDYDCPVGISYKVAVLSMCGTYYDDDATILDMTTADYNHRSFITVFGNDKDGTNAAKNLKDRADNRTIDGYEGSHGYIVLESMDDGTLADELWLSKIYSYGTPGREDGNTYKPTALTAAEAIEYIGYNEPMSVTGAFVESEGDSTDISVGDYEPLTPLRKVWVTDIKVQLRENTIQVPVGGEYYLIDITVDGFDEENVPYYGFQSSWGTWEILDDETGEPVDPSIAEIVTSATTGKAKLKVYQAYDGLVLKYKIPENKYKSVQETAYTKNSDLISTAYVDVVVKDSVSNIRDYSDVSENDWFFDSVDFVSDQSIMSGVGNDMFAPNSTCTRAMMAAILWKMHGSETPTLHSPFNDLTADWYKNAVIWAAQNGIANGISDKGFAPDLNVTREQFATFLYRYAQFKEGVLKQDEETPVFTPAHLEFVVSDVDISGFGDSEAVSDYAQDAVKWAVEKGIISGTPEGNIDPQGTATRAEIATMIARYL